MYTILDIKHNFIKSMYTLINTEININLFSLIIN